MATYPLAHICPLSIFPKTVRTSVRPNDAASPGAPCNASSPYSHTDALLVTKKQEEPTIFTSIGVRLLCCSNGCWMASSIKNSQPLFVKYHPSHCFSKACGGQNPVERELQDHFELLRERPLLGIEWTENNRRVGVSMCGVEVKAICGLLQESRLLGHQ